MEIFIQGIGIIGVVTGILAYQSNEHKKILLYRIYNELCFALQYALLQAYAGCLVNLLVCVRNQMFRSYVQKGKNTMSLVLIFCALFILSTIMTWPGPSGLMIILTKLFSTTAFGCKNPTHLRILNLLSGITWLIYNMSVHSYAGICCELLSIVSIGIALARFDLFPKLNTKVSD